MIVKNNPLYSSTETSVCSSDGGYCERDYCDAKCLYCQPGQGGDKDYAVGGVKLTSLNGIDYCTESCSTDNYCGTGDAYNSGTDCTDCPVFKGRTCTGTADACSTYTEKGQETCNSIGGCEWDSRGNVCTKLDAGPVCTNNGTQASCFAMSGCNWEPSGICSGDTGCSTYKSDKTCTTATGCTWTPGGSSTIWNTWCNKFCPNNCIWYYDPGTKSCTKDQESGRYDCTNCKTESSGLIKTNLITADTTQSSCVIKDGTWFTAKNSELPLTTWATDNKVCTKGGACKWQAPQDCAQWSGSTGNAGICETTGNCVAKLNFMGSGVGKCTVKVGTAYTSPDQEKLCQLKYQDSLSDTENAINCEASADCRWAPTDSIRRYCAEIGDLNICTKDANCTWVNNCLWTEDCVDKGTQNECDATGQCQWSSLSDGTSGDPILGDISKGCNHSTPFGKLACQVAGCQWNPPTTPSKITDNQQLGINYGEKVFKGCKHYDFATRDLDKAGYCTGPFDSIDSKGGNLFSESDQCSTLNQDCLTGTWNSVTAIEPGLENPGSGCSCLGVAECDQNSVKNICDSTPSCPSTTASSDEKYTNFATEPKKTLEESSQVEDNLGTSAGINSYKCTNCLTENAQACPVYQNLALPGNTCSETTYGIPCSICKAGFKTRPTNNTCQSVAGFNWSGDISPWAPDTLGTCIGLTGAQAYKARIASGSCSNPKYSDDPTACVANLANWSSSYGQCANNNSLCIPKTDISACDSPTNCQQRTTELSCHQNGECDINTCQSGYKCYGADSSFKNPTITSIDGDAEAVFYEVCKSAGGMMRSHNVGTICDNPGELCKTEDLTVNPGRCTHSYTKSRAECAKKNIKWGLQPCEQRGSIEDCCPSEDSNCGLGGNLGSSYFRRRSALCVETMVYKNIRKSDLYRKVNTISLRWRP